MRSVNPILGFLMVNYPYKPNFRSLTHPHGLEEAPVVPIPVPGPDKEFFSPQTCGDMPLVDLDSLHPAGTNPLGGDSQLSTGFCTPHTPEPSTRAFGARRIIYAHILQKGRSSSSPWSRLPPHPRSAHRTLKAGMTRRA